MTTRDNQLQLPSIRRRVLGDEALATLRTAIMSNQLEPGMRLLEADLAESLGVSRAPVREALRQLQQEGLVEIFPHRGAVVVGLPDDELDTVYEMRALIEQKAMERACERVTDEDLETLEALVDSMRAAVRKEDIEELASLDLAFHGRILDISELTFLRRTWSGLAGLVRIRSYQALERPGKASAYFIETSVLSHERLIEALRTRDPKVASSTVREHILEVAARLGTERG